MSSSVSLPAVSLPSQPDELQIVPSKVPGHLTAFVEMLPQEVGSLLSSFSPEKWAKLLQQSDANGESLTVVHKVILAHASNRAIPELQTLADDIQKTLSKWARSDFSDAAYSRFEESKLLLEEPQDETVLRLGSELTDQAFQKMSVRFRNIVELDVSRSPLTDRDFQHIKNFERLEKLFLNSCKQLSWKAFSAGLACNVIAPTLQVLELEGADIHDMGVRLIIQKLKNLTQLNLSGCGKITAFFFKTEEFALPKLQKLNLSETGIDGEGIRNVAKAIVSITHLNLSSCAQLEAEDFAVDLPQTMQDLDVSCTAIDNASLQKQLKILTNLTAVNITACQDITSQGLGECDIQPALREIKLWYTNIDKKTRQDLTAKYTTLKLHSE